MRRYRRAGGPATVFASDAGAQLEPIWRELEEHARREVLADGVAARKHRSRRFARSICATGASKRRSTFLVPPMATSRRATNELHEQLYGYRHDGRRRSKSSPPASKSSATLPEPAEAAAELDRSAATCLDRRPTWSSTGDAYPNARLRARRSAARRRIRRAGHRLRADVDRGRRSRIPGRRFSPRGEMLLTDDVAPADSDLSRPQVDPVQLEIFNNLFASIAEQMGVDAAAHGHLDQRERAARFQLRDLLGQRAIWSSTRRTSPCIWGRWARRSSTFWPTIRRHGAGRRVRHERSVSRRLAPARRHGRHAGARSERRASSCSSPPAARITPRSAASCRAACRRSRECLGDEGVLIRNFKLVDAARSREDELRQLLARRALSDAERRRQPGRHRRPGRRQRDRGVRELRRLVERYSLPVVAAYMEHIQQAAAQKMRSALSAIPDGTYSRTDHLDDGSPICVAITNRGERAIVDFTGTGPVLATNLNANRAIVTAAVLYVFRCLINEDIPLNGGVLEPVEIVLPDCLLNPTPAADPAQSPAVVGGNVETSQRVVERCSGRLASAAASQGTMNNLTFGDATFGYYETICGGSGATPTPTVPTPSTRT